MNMKEQNSDYKAVINLKMTKEGENFNYKNSRTFNCGSVLQNFALWMNE